MSARRHLTPLGPAVILDEIQRFEPPPPPELPPMPAEVEHLLRTVYAFLALPFASNFRGWLRAYGWELRSAHQVSASGEKEVTARHASGEDFTVVVSTRYEDACQVLRMLRLRAASASREALVGDREELNA